MKIIILHGDHITASYNRLQEYIKAALDKNYEVQKLQNYQNFLMK